MKKTRSELNNKLQALEADFTCIPNDRKAQLKKLSEAINQQLNTYGKSQITVICTHNSRRSQLAQLFLKVGANYYNCPAIFAFSGGTEAVAFHPNMVAAIKRFGFSVEEFPQDKNPKYYIPVYGDKRDYDLFYSKRYDENYNPSEAFIAVMVCTEADGGCPFVAGSTHRISLPYDDPKVADGKPNETIAYDKKVAEIGREMMFVIAELVNR